MQTRRKALINQKNDVSNGIEHNEIPIICDNNNKLPMFKYLKFHDIGIYFYDKIKFNGCNCINGYCSNNECKCYSGFENSNRKVEIIECSSHCNCDIDKCKNRKYLTKYFNPKIEIVYNEIKCHGGFGIFAKEKIEAKRVVGMYYGNIIAKTSKALDNRRFLYGFAIDDRMTGMEIIINSEEKGNFTRFLNHSCDYNLYSKIGYIGENVLIPTPIFFAKRDIESGEQLTIDYGEKFFNQFNPCKCGSSNCKYIYFENNNKTDIKSGNRKNEIATVFDSMKENKKPLDIKFNKTKTKVRIPVKTMNLKQFEENNEKPFQKAVKSKNFIKPLESLDLQIRNNQNSEFHEYSIKSLSEEMDIDEKSVIYIDSDEEPSIHIDNDEESMLRSDTGEEQIASIDNDKELIIRIDSREESVIRIGSEEPSIHNDNGEESIICIDDDKELTIRIETDEESTICIDSDESIICIE